MVPRYFDTLAMLWYEEMHVLLVTYVSNLNRYRSKDYWFSVRMHRTEMNMCIVVLLGISPVMKYESIEIKAYWESNFLWVLVNM